MFRGGMQQSRHGRTFIHKHARVPLWLRQGQSTLQWHERSPRIVVCKGMEHQDLDYASRPAAAFCRLEQPVQESRGLDRRATGQQRPRERDVLVLVQIAELILDRETVLTRPFHGLTTAPVAHQHSRARRRDWAHIRGEVNHEERLGSAQQIEGRSEVAQRLVDARHGYPPAIRVLRKPGLGTDLLALEQRLGGCLQFVPLALDLAEAHIHIRRPARGSATLFACEPQRLLIGPCRVAETTLCDAYIGECHSPTDDC